LGYMMSMGGDADGPSAAGRIAGGRIPSVSDGHDGEGPSARGPFGRAHPTSTVPARDSMETARARPNGWQIGLPLAIPFTGLLSTALLIPVLPKIAAALHIPFRQATWLVVLPSLVAGLFIPVAGYLADRWTRTVVL